MDDEAIRRAALVTLRRVICERFPPGRRKMMQAWADYLEGLRAGANVMPFRRPA